MNLVGGWRDWGRSLALALLLLLTLHLFVVRWVTVANTSMYATLVPGDLLLVERWPLWTGLQRGDIVVFHDPVEDDRSMYNRRLLVKRIVGSPGDKVEIRKGVLFVNGSAFPIPAGQTKSWSVRLVPGARPDSLIAALGLPHGYALPEADLLDLPLNKALAERLEHWPMVAGLSPRSSAKGAPDHIFPFSPERPWNNDSYGPLTVPSKGASVGLSAYDLPLYDRIVSRYEDNKVEVVDGKLQVNGDASGTYTIRQDYYFVLGDARDASSDSRYWGFVPADHLVGKASLVLFNRHAKGNTLLGDRTLKALSN